MASLVDMERPLRKICMLGDYRVGKTRLVRALTQSTLGPPEAGVHLRFWRCPMAPSIEFALFDVAGRTAIDSVGQSFLADADGFMLVADGNRSETVDIAVQLHRVACGLIGPRPAVLVLNTSDGADGALDQIKPYVSADLPAFAASADTGDGVLTAFCALAERVLASPHPIDRPDATMAAGTS